MRPFLNCDETATLLKGSRLVVEERKGHTYCMVEPAGRLPTPRVQRNPISSREARKHTLGGSPGNRRGAGGPAGEEVMLQRR